MSTFFWMYNISYFIHVVLFNIFYDWIQIILRPRLCCHLTNWQSIWNYLSCHVTWSKIKFLHTSKIVRIISTYLVETFYPTELLTASGSVIGLFLVGLWMLYFRNSSLLSKNHREKSPFIHVIILKIMSPWVITQHSM